MTLSLIVLSRIFFHELTLVYQNLLRLNLIFIVRKIAKKKSMAGEVVLLVWIPEVLVPEARIPLVFVQLQYEMRRDHDDVFPR